MNYVRNQLMNQWINDPIDASVVSGFYESLNGSDNKYAYTLTHNKCDGPTEWQIDGPTERRT